MVDMDLEYNWAVMWNSGNKNKNFCQGNLVTEILQESSGFKVWQCSRH